MICGSQEAQRRGLMFVAASANDSTMSFGAWRDHAQQVLRHTTGLASSFILDPEATTELRGALGRTHAVEPWTIRTFRPDADPADESDALRHRVLSTGRLASDDPAYLARLLGWRAREAALDTPLQSSALRLERDLERAYDEMLMQSAFTKVMPDADAAGAGKERVSPSDELGVAERPRRAQRARETLHVSGRQRGDAQLIKRLIIVLRGVFPHAEPTSALIDELGVLALTGAGSRESQQAVRQRLSDLEGQAESLEDQRQQVQLCRT